MPRQRFPRPLSNISGMLVITTGYLFILSALFVHDQVPNSSSMKGICRVQHAPTRRTRG
ncbi:hypothetical protein LY78DRAFT_661042 [Colletotrichum sublineola]|nr:hypothetical protein LY78DRAFT_661042 [Colletotrichum sublineola]